MAVFQKSVLFQSRVVFYVTFQVLFDILMHIVYLNLFNQISVDESGEKTITEDYDGRSEGVAVKNGIVCNVVYTSFESDNSVNFTTDNDSQLAAGTSKTKNQPLKILSALSIFVFGVQLPQTLQKLRISALTMEFCPVKQ